MKGFLIRKTLISVLFVLMIILIDFITSIVYFKLPKTEFTRANFLSIELISNIIIIAIIFYISIKTKLFTIHNDFEITKLKRKYIVKRILTFIKVIAFTAIIFGIVIHYSDVEKFSIEKNLTLLSFFVTIILTPITEELIFRKIILGMFKFNLKTIFYGIFLNSLLFSLLHYDFLNLDEYKILSVFILGIFLSIIFLNYGILYAIISHVTWNFLSFYEHQISHYLNSIFQDGSIFVGMILILLMFVAFINEFKLFLKKYQNSTLQMSTTPTE